LSIKSGKIVGKQAGVGSAVRWGPAYKTHLNPPFLAGIDIENPSSHIPPYTHDPKIFPYRKTG
jgi:hypothetical protein